MKDIFGKTLEVGDIVAFNPPSYKGLIKGKVLGFTPLKVKIEYYYSGTGKNTTTVQWPRDLVKFVL
jgi:hypothetical protein